ncbi:MAG: hypothetical protein H6660_17535 [Ardenticatenaceae bacterium]|nr:hypothetical protein [Ardenticatenaceae bacterium]
MIQKTKFLFADIFSIFALLVGGWKYTRALETVLDIRLYDESSYLWGGLNLFNLEITKGTVTENTQVYAFWYHLLAQFQPDSILLYYLNYKILTILLPVMLYLVLRRYKLPVIPCTIISFSLLISYANLGVWPKVSHFTLLIILACLFIISFMKSKLTSFTVMTIGSLFCAYARPEFFLTFVVLFLLLVLIILLEIRNHRKISVVSITFIIVCISIMLTVIHFWGVPTTTTRSYGAFAQHFSLNWVNWTNNQELSAWADWDKIMYLNFGETGSIQEAFIHNPLLFIKHVSTNLKSAPIELLHLFSTQISFVRESTFSNLSAITIIIMLVSLIFLFKEPEKVTLKEKLHNYSNVLIFIGCYLSVSFLSVAVIFPRSHYLIFFAVLSLVILTIFLPGIGNKFVYRDHKLLIILVGLIGIFVTPQYAQLIDHSVNKENVNTFEFLRSLAIEEEVYLLEAKGGVHIYVGNNYHRIAQYNKATSFDDFRRENKINAILITSSLTNDSRFKNDKDWTSFLKNYQDLGFISLDIPGSEGQLILEKHLINQ